MTMSQHSVHHSQLFAPCCICPCKVAENLANFDHKLEMVCNSSSSQFHVNFSELQNFANIN